MGIFANGSGPTTVRNAFLLNSIGVRQISLCAPFFSYPEIIDEIGTTDRTFGVLVRLGSATPPDALRKAMGLPNVRLRFFTSSKFHSKLYIFGNRCALVGSANLTGAGLQSNREIIMVVPGDHPDFDDLVSLFQSYWNDAGVLDETRLKQYEKLWARRSPAKSPDDEFDDNVRHSFGDVAPLQGVQVGAPKPSAEQLYLEDYRREYQEFLSAFREVEEIYKHDGRRQQPGLPLRIEIDQFFSYVRDVHCPKDSYLHAPHRTGDERHTLVGGLIDQWFKQRWLWLDDHVAAAFPRINARLGTPEAVAASSMEQILDALEVCHAFLELLRFYLGGLPAVRREFSRTNDLQRVKNSFTYLLHGKDSFIDRMGAVIFDPAFKLAMVGHSVAQELLGWVNHDNIPICNGRTIKSLHFLGYGLIHVPAVGREDDDAA